MTQRELTVAGEDRLLLTASPHLKAPDSTPKIMWNVVGSLVPVVLVAVYYFGPSAIAVIAAATAGARGVEWIFGKGRSLWDGSAAITGILLGLCLPAGFPLWMAFLGGAFGIAFGKLVFGGLGQNPFNPALVGRAFLQAAFPTAITTWPSTQMEWGAWKGANFSVPLLTGSGRLERNTLGWFYPSYHHSTPAMALREGNLKLIEFFEDGRLELYDLSKDLGEKENLVELMPEKASELRARLSTMRQSVGARLPVPNPDYDPEKANIRIDGNKDAHRIDLSETW